MADQELLDALGKMGDGTLSNAQAEHFVDFVIEANNDMIRHWLRQWRRIDQLSCDTCRAKNLCPHSHDLGCRFNCCSVEAGEDTFVVDLAAGLYFPTCDACVWGGICTTSYDPDSCCLEKRQLKAMPKIGDAWRS